MTTLEKLELESNPHYQKLLKSYGETVQTIIELKEVKEELVEALEMASKSIEETINRTQTGDRRNRFTEENIIILTAIEKSKSL